MTRRLQLLEPERRPERRGLRGLSSRHLVAGGGSLLRGLLRDNKVLPPILALLALLVFAWLLGGVFLGSPNEDRQQVSQGSSSLAQQGAQQGAQEGQNSQSSQAKDSGAPSPSTDNRDSGSFDAYRSKDPFRELFQSKDTNNGDGGGTKGSSRGSSSSGGSSSRGPTDQRPTGNPNSSRGAGGNAGSGDNSGTNGSSANGSSANGSSANGSSANGSGANGNNVGQGGRNLFNSGGDLAP